ncbi:MAG: metallophosphoesterase [Candidatus Pacearchaeota archaeon]
MKILALSDFHGSFPSFIKKVIKKEKVDVVVSVGDYPTSTKLKEIIKNFGFYRGFEGWEVIGVKKYKELFNKDIRNGKKVIDKLNDLDVLVVSTIGNHDYPYPDDLRDDEDEEEDWDWALKKVNELPNYVKKKRNIRKIDYSYARVGGYVFVGMRGHSNPGKVKSEAYRKHKKILEEIFRKFKKENREGKLIFVSHNSPYETKLDKITSKDAPEEVRGKHYGSKMAKRVLRKWQPVLSISGHIEEGKGKDKIGKTVAVNCGSVQNGDYALIELNDKTGKVSRVRFGKS